LQDSQAVQQSRHFNPVIRFRYLASNTDCNKEVRWLWLTMPQTTARNPLARQDYNLQRSDQIGNWAVSSKQYITETSTGIVQTRCPNVGRQTTEESYAVVCSWEMPTR